MEFTIKSGSPEKQRSACVVVGVFDNRKLSLSAELIDRASNGYISVSVRDSAGVNVVRTTTDSAGTLVTKETIDSSRTRRPTPLELFRALRARDDSLFRARTDSANRLAARDSTVFGRSPFRSDSMFSFGGARSIVVGNAGTLVSGLASIRATLEAFNAGKLQSYPQAIAMTKIDGWK